MSRLTKIMENGQIDCWTLGDYRVSVLIKNGVMYRSQNVKKEVIRTRISLPHSNLMTWRRIGAKNGSRWTVGHSWPMYRPIVLNILLRPSFGLAWAKNMTFRKFTLLGVLPDTWRNICLRTLFFQPSGLKAGDVSVTRNPFPNYHAEQLLRLYLSNLMTGENLRNSQSLWTRLKDFAPTNVSGV